VNGNLSTPILAAEAGIVRISGSYPAWYGNYVVIEHANGIFTGYGHLASLAVREGQQVTKGQRLGIIGTTGPSTGIHLHFQFFRNGPWPQQNDFINPRDMMQF
jgi:murein DD-endopeptidase MepM/ murein hydrolase activator NlpD